MATQQFRYMMITGIVLLTIFVYVIYSTNDMQVPGRIHSVPSISSLTGFGGSNTDGILSTDNRYNLNGTLQNNNNNNNLSKNISYNKLIIEDQHKGQFPEDVNVSNANSLPDTSSSIVQLQNSQVIQLSSSSSDPAKTVLNMPNSTDVLEFLKSLEKAVSKLNEDQFESVSNNVSSSSLSQLPIIRAGLLDTTKGIRTADLYESGHLESNSELCPELGGPLRLLILITSAPTHRDARLAIRQTWGHYGTRRDITIGFMLGTTENPALEEQLAAENYMYGDLIRGHFIDSYNNLTLKTISLLEWVDIYCPKVSFVLKTDDDMFINVPKLIAFVEQHHKDTRVIYGRLAKKWKPIRNKKSKYYVSPQQYFPSVFPQFTTGPAYLMTSDVIHDLYTKSLNQTYLKLEDVFTTGIVAHLSNIKRIHVNEFLNRRIAFNPCNIKKAISVHMVKSNEQFDLWKKLLDTNTKCK